VLADAAPQFALDAKDVSVEYVPVKMPPSPIRSAAASRVGRHSMATVSDVDCVGGAPCRTMLTVAAAHTVLLHRCLCCHAAFTAPPASAHVVDDSVAVVCLPPPPQTPTHMRESPLFARWDNEARVASVLRELSVSTPLGASADVPPRSTCTTATSPVTCGTTDRRLQTSPALAFVLNSAERQRVVGHAVSDLLSDIVMRSAAVSDVSQRVPLTSDDTPG
jgi:hypothetical protein